MPPVRKKDSKTDKAGISRGKLVDKFRNKLRFIRSAEKLKNSVKDATVVTEGTKTFYLSRCTLDRFW